MGTSTKPEIGDQHLDATGLELLELSTDQSRRATKVREGFGRAIGCLTRTPPEVLKELGISTDEVARAAVLKVEYEQCEVFLPPAEKLVEKLRDTKTAKGHDISLILINSARQARYRAERDPKAAELLGALSDLIEYLTAPAYKAAATRFKIKITEEVIEEGEEPAPESKVA